jgi:hypothetical protein
MSAPGSLWLVIWVRGTYRSTWPPPMPGVHEGCCRDVLPAPLDLSVIPRGGYGTPRRDDLP